MKQFTHENVGDVVSKLQNAYSSVCEELGISVDFGTIKYDS